jgi:hypothetical protein
MTTPIEPIYRSYARRMLDVDELPKSLEEKLATVEELVQKVKPHGCLSSTQTIASIIMLWELEQLIQHFDL